MPKRRNGEPFLIKASPNSTFDILLRRAEQDGRIGGKFRCEICGMTHMDQTDAKTCCEKLRAKARR